MTDLITRMNEAMPLGLPACLFVPRTGCHPLRRRHWFERTKRLKEAAIRTHCLVCCASALIMIVSKYAFADLSVDGAFSLRRPRRRSARIAAQVVSGISFIGLAVIYRNGST